MRRLAGGLLLAFCSWFVPFAASVCIFPLRTAHRPLFESIMSLVLTANTIALGCVALRRLRGGRPVLAGLTIGVAWMIANWLLDAAVFSHGPMHMTLRQYLGEIAPAYLVIPVMTTGLGVAARSAIVGSIGGMGARPQDNRSTTSRSL